MTEQVEWKEFANGNAGPLMTSQKVQWSVNARQSTTPPPFGPGSFVLSDIHDHLFRLWG